MSDPLLPLLSWLWHRIHDIVGASAHGRFVELVCEGRRNRGAQGMALHSSAPRSGLPCAPPWRVGSFRASPHCRMNGVAHVFPFLHEENVLHAHRSASRWRVSSRPLFFGCVNCPWVLLLFLKLFGAFQSSRLPDVVLCHALSQHRFRSATLLRLRATSLQRQRQRARTAPAPRRCGSSLGRVERH